MFVRVKKAGKYHYLQIAENHREGKHVKQTVIATLGRLDKLAASGAIDQLVRSAARFADHIMVRAQHTTAAHYDPDATVTSIGPALNLRTTVARHWLPGGGARVTDHKPPSLRCRTRGVHDRAAPSHGLGLRP